MDSVRNGWRRERKSLSTMEITEEDRKFYFRDQEFDVDDYNDGVQDISNLKG